MKIVKISNERFGKPRLYREVSGYAFYEEGKGYIAFSCDRDKFGILIPYIPRGGKKALQIILDDGGFISFDGVEYVMAMRSKA